MTPNEKKEMIESIKAMAEGYFDVFAIFLAKTGSVEQAFRLTKDMHAAIFNQNENKKDSLSIFWDRGGDGQN